MRISHPGNREEGYLLSDMLIGILILSISISAIFFSISNAFVHVSQQKNILKEQIQIDENYHFKIYYKSEEKE